MTRGFQAERASDFMGEAREEFEPEELPPEQEAADEPYSGPADPFTQQEGYFPPKGDQSWRELEALRFAPGHEMDFVEEEAETEFVAPGPLMEPESSGPGWKGVLLALLMVPAVGFAIVALTAPAILTAKFWRMGADNSAAKPTAAPMVAANVPAPAPLPQSTPPAQQLPNPGMDAAPAPNPVTNAPAAAANTPAPGPVVDNPSPPEAQTADTESQNADVDSHATPASNAIADATPDANAPADADTNVQATPKPAPKPAGHVAKRPRSGSRSGSGFYAKVIQPDGSLRTEYFPSKPGSGPRLAMRDAGRGRTADRGEGGFYTMVIQPDGSLEYRHFPARPLR